MLNPQVAVLVATAFAVLDAAPYRQRFPGGGYYPQAYYGDYYGYSPYYQDSYSGYPYSAYSPTRANPFQGLFSRFSSWPESLRYPSNPFRIVGQVCVHHAQPRNIVRTRVPRVVGLSLFGALSNWAEKAS